MLASCLLLLALASCPQNANPTPAAELATESNAPTQTLWIGTWNIRFLGPSYDDSYEHREPAALGQYVADSGVSILALQEIGLTAGLDHRGNDTLDRVFSWMRENGHGSWQYELFFTHRSPNQLTGVAWNSAHVTHQETLSVPLESGGASRYKATIWDRHPSAVKLSAGRGLTDIVVIPVHMKSNRASPGQRPRLHRGLEADLLVGALDDIMNHFWDEDIVILGDFNTKHAREPAMRAFEKAGFLDLNAVDGGTYLSRRNPPFDRILFPRGQPEFHGAELYVMTIEGMSDADFSRDYSDHRMAVAELTVLRDDD